MLLNKETKATLALSIFMCAAKKKAIIESFRYFSYALTVARTAGAAAVCKAHGQSVKIIEIDGLPNFVRYGAPLARLRYVGTPPLM